MGSTRYSGLARFFSSQRSRISKRARENVYNARRKETESTELKNNLISVVERPWPVATVSSKERTSPSLSLHPLVSANVYSWEKIFLAADDRRQRLPIVVTPINNPFFTSIPFFSSLFSSLPAIQFSWLPLRSICLRNCSGDHISPRRTRTTIGEKTQELCNFQREQNRDICTFLIKNQFVKLFYYRLFTAYNTWILNHYNLAYFASFFKLN